MHQEGALVQLQNMINTQQKKHVKQLPGRPPELWAELDDAAGGSGGLAVKVINKSAPKTIDKFLTIARIA